MPENKKLEQVQKAEDTSTVSRSQGVPGQDRQCTK